MCGGLGVGWQGWVVGCGVWVLSECTYDKNDDSTVLITNAPKGPTFSQWTKKSKSLEWTKKPKSFWPVRFFTDSHIEGGRFGDMDFFVHSRDLDFVIETHPPFAS